MTRFAFLLPGIVNKAKAWVASLSQWLIGFGAFGIFALTLIDSALIPTAGAPDLAIVTFSLAKPDQWWVFAIAAALGSTIGCFILYSLAQKAGGKLLASVSQDRRARIENLLGRWDLLTLIVASLLPPPFPFKPFIICAGAVRFNRFRLFIGLLIGRGIRYGVLAYLARYYGEQALKLIAQNSGWIFLGVGILAVGVWLYQRFFSGKNNVIPPSEVHSLGD